jgi:hypothetical protein
MNSRPTVTAVVKSHKTDDRAFYLGDKKLAPADPFFEAPPHHEAERTTVAIRQLFDRVYLLFLRPSNSHQQPPTLCQAAPTGRLGWPFHPSFLLFAC